MLGNVGKGAKNTYKKVVVDYSIDNQTLEPLYIIKINDESYNKYQKWNFSMTCKSYTTQEPIVSLVIVHLIAIFFKFLNILICKHPWKLILNLTKFFISTWNHGIKENILISFDTIMYFNSFILTANISTTKFIVY